MSDACYLEVAGGGFSYVIERRPRRKSVGIQVRADGRVIVAAHPGVPADDLKQLLRDKSAWVQRRLAKAAEQREQRAARRYDTGSSVLFQGHAMRLQLHDGMETRLDREGGELYLGMDGAEDRGREAVKAALEVWFRQQALIVFTDRCRHFSAWLRQRPTHIGIKGYRTRWGSCHADGRVYFNWRLVMAPPFVIDYVVVHELCHLKQRNHSADFWTLVEDIVPAHADARRWLRQYGPVLDI